LEFCQSFPPLPRPEDVDPIPDNRPCCQFAFASALLALESPPFLSPQNWAYSYLLPLSRDGRPVLTDLPSFPVYKWKIGRRDFAAESAELPRIFEKLPPSAQLRLDANGTLTLADAQKWLALADHWGRIEFLEQPLAPSKLREMKGLARDFATPIALDESVSSIEALERLFQKNWPGLYVLKVAILGSSQGLTAWLKQTSGDRVIYSSALETEIGRRNVLQWVARWGGPKRALGFGVDAWLGAS
ncbi:MAG: o-succinylbenzoate synthase, partial [Cyanobacteriota bacterium]